MQGFDWVLDDGYVLDLGIYNVPEMDYMLLKFQVKPTQRSLTWDKRKYYEPWVIMKRDGEVITAHDECLGDYDGACRHVAAGLFEIERTIGENVAKPSVTEVLAYGRRERKLIPILLKQRNRQLKEDP